jgi:hypothetical protein
MVAAMLPVMAGQRSRCGNWHRRSCAESGAATRPSTPANSPTPATHSLSSYPTQCRISMHRQRSARTPATAAGRVRRSRSASVQVMPLSVPVIHCDCVGESVQRCGAVGRGCGYQGGAVSTASRAAPRGGRGNGQETVAFTISAPSFYRGAPLLGCVRHRPQLPLAELGPVLEARVEYRSLNLPGS